MNDPVNFIKGMGKLGTAIFKAPSEFVENIGAGMSVKQSLGATFLDDASKGWRRAVIKDGKPVLNSRGEQVMEWNTDNIRFGRIAGTAWGIGTAASIGAGAVRGILTDSDGQLDVPGIPFI